MVELCPKNQNKIKHGLCGHRLYDTWKSMVHRCNNIKNVAYKYYGGRGVKVCDRWLNVENFIEDMYPSFQEGLTLDRIDVNGDYEPNNCRWESKITQSQNTRDCKISNTSGFRGVYYSKRDKVWISQIRINYKRITLGSTFNSALEAAKAYETYVRVNKLQHKFTPSLTEDEILKIEKDIK